MPCFSDAPGRSYSRPRASASGPLSPCETETINFVGGLWRARRWVGVVAVGAAALWFWPHDKPVVRRAELVVLPHHHHAKHALARTQ